VYHRLTTTLLRDIITEHLEYGRVGTCLVPQSVRNVLNSLACHGTSHFLISDFLIFHSSVPLFLFYFY